MSHLGCPKSSDGCYFGQTRQATFFSLFWRFSGMRRQAQKGRKGRVARDSYAFESRPPRAQCPHLSRLRSSLFQKNITLVKTTPLLLILSERTHFPLHPRFLLPLHPEVQMHLIQNKTSRGSLQSFPMGGKKTTTSRQLRHLPSTPGEAMWKNGVTFAHRKYRKDI